MLQEQLKLAMKENDPDQKRIIRLALSSISFVEKEKKGELSDSDYVAVIQREIKIRNEAISEAIKGNRQDIVLNNQKEIVLLEQFLPKQFTDNELTQYVIDAIEVTSAQSMKDMGKVIKHLLLILEGKASNDRIVKIVQMKLNENN
jgi:hypothetical protein